MNQLSLNQLYAVILIQHATLTQFVIFIHREETMPTANSRHKSFPLPFYALRATDQKIPP
jgi:hypothetical protein